MFRRSPRHTPCHLLEPLEPRIKLSASAFPAPTESSVSGTQSSDVRYRTAALSAQQAAGQYGKAYTNAHYADAQDYFNLSHNSYTPYVPPAPAPTDTPVPATDQIPTSPEPTGAQSSVLNTGAFTSDPITISQTTLGNFSRLIVTGTSGNDYILISQSGDTLLITANGATTQLPATFTEIALYGLDGDDALTIQSSVALTTLVYPGSGTNTVADLSLAPSFIVSLGAGADTLTGDGTTTDFWADLADTITNGVPATIHRVSSFYQPFSKDPTNANYIPTTLAGQSLPDPTDSGTSVRLAASLWGTGPTMFDMNQGQIGDCYFLADLQSLAANNPTLLQHLAVDLGDGTYAVQFKRNNTYSYVRVDADLPTNGTLVFAHPSPSGAIWAAIFEKAYALFRTSSPTYNSLNWGWVGTAFNDLGIANTSFNTASPNIFSTLCAALANNKAVAAISNGTIPAGIPIVASHAYSVISATVEAGTAYLTLRNPWGTDGAGHDANSSDGLLTLTLTQFQAAFSAGCLQT